eukprot:1160996-Pelagomonas_calceolata.AAC.8
MQLDAACSALDGKDMDYESTLAFKKEFARKVYDLYGQETLQSNDFKDVCCFTRSVSKLGSQLAELECSGFTASLLRVCEATRHSERHADRHEHGCASSACKTVWLPVGNVMLWATWRSALQDK